MNLLSALILLRNATAVVGAIGNVIGDIRYEAGELTDEQEATLKTKLLELKLKQQELEISWKALAPGLPI